MYEINFARDLIQERCRALDTEEISVMHAGGRILSEDILGKDGQDENIKCLHCSPEQVVLSSGCLVRPIIHGTLLSLGITKVKVHKKPLIGLFIIGQDPPDPEDAKAAVNFNRHVAGNALKEAEFSWIFQGTTPLEQVQLVPLLRSACTAYDAVVFCGGSDTKDYDEIMRILRESQAELLIDGVDAEPGSGFCAGILDEVPIFGLTGDAVDVLTQVYLLVVPALRKIAGHKSSSPLEIMVELDADFAEHNLSSRVIFGKLEFSDGIVRMRGNDSGIDGERKGIWSLQDIDVCALIPANAGPIKRGTLIRAYKIEK